VSLVRRGSITRPAAEIQLMTKHVPRVTHCMTDNRGRATSSGCVCWLNPGQSPGFTLSLSTCVPYNLPTGALYMSTTNRTAGSSRSNDNFTAIFQAASDEYHRVTGKPLDTHPFTTQLDGCDSPEAALKVFRTQAQAFSKFRKTMRN
jgi:hypothetical protein